MSTTDGSPIRERADRARNRELIAQVAREEFARADSSGETLSMNEVARAAHVGIATLYRHFPTRDDLAAAVYQAKLDEVMARVDRMTTDKSGRDALRLWAAEFSTFMLGTRGMMDTLRASWQSPTESATTTTATLAETVELFLREGAADGTLRRDLDPTDVTVALLSLLSSTPPGDTGARSRRLIALFIDGLSRT